MTTVSYSICLFVCLFKFHTSNQPTLLLGSPDDLEDIKEQSMEIFDTYSREKCIVCTNITVKSLYIKTPLPP